MSKKQRIEELEDEVAYLLDMLEEVAADHEEELAVNDSRLNDLEEFMEKLHWAVTSNE